MPSARLTDRAVLTIEGPEARTFLDRLVTCDLDRIAPGGTRFGALLTPQGKIIADFLIVDASGEEPAFYLDMPAGCAGDLVKRLGMYRLRARLRIADVSAEKAVLVGWDEEAAPEGAVIDPRLSTLGWRAIVPAGSAIPPGDAPYRAHRIRLGVPEGGEDYCLGDAFPHEALMDQLAGVDFDKGCYVGQEVVSRMQHRGTARTRVVSVLFDAPGDGEVGAPVTAGDRALGTLGGVAGETALALIRLDRAADALASGEPILAGGRPVRLVKPPFVRFPYPGDRAAA